MPDPGSRTGRIVALLVGLPLLVLVVILQQTAIYMAPPAATAPEAAVTAPGPDDQALLVTRLMLKMNRAWPAMSSSGEPLNSLDALWTGDSGTPVMADERDWQAAMDARIVELRAATVAGETAGPSAALLRLETLDVRLTNDADALEKIWDGADLGEEPDWASADDIFRPAAREAGAPESESPDAAANPDAALEEDASPATAGGQAPVVPATPDLTATLNRSAKVIQTLRVDVALLKRHYTALVRAANRAAGVPVPQSPGASSPALPPAAALVPGPVARLIVPGFTSPLDDEAWAALGERHGWFAELARIAATPDDNAERAEMFRNGGALLAVILAAAVVLGSVALASLCACIWLIVMLATGRIRFWFVPPAPGGSVYLETVAVFIVLFLGTQILATAVASVPSLANYATEVSMAMQWLVLLAIFWPLLRGVDVKRWRRDLGLIAPRGVMREVGAGCLAYLASLPMLVAAGVLGVVLKAIQDDLLKDHISPTTGGNPVFEMVSQGGALQLILLFTLATIWAPIVEETVFRGCLFRHMRSRVGFLIAAPASALAFGLMHQYEIVLLGPVLALGVMFAFMREWRGSLVGPIVMHALHNGTVLFFIITLLRLSA